MLESSQLPEALGDLMLFLRPHKHLHLCVHIPAHRHTHAHKYISKIKYLGAGEMVQQSRAVIILAEDTRLIPSIHL